MHRKSILDMMAMETITWFDLTPDLIWTASRLAKRDSGAGGADLFVAKRPK